MALGDNTLRPFTLPTKVSPALPMQIRNNDNLMRQGFNAHAVDSVAHVQSGLLVNRPSTPPVGTTYIVTNVGSEAVTIYTSLGWVSVSGGGGGGSLSGSGTNTKLAKWTGASSLGDSIVTEGTGVVTVAGNVDITTGNTYKINNVTVLSSTALGSGIGVAPGNLAGASAARKFLTTSGGALAWDFLPTFNTTQDGAVPTPGSALGATYYLNATGNWSVPTVSSIAASGVTGGTIAVPGPGTFSGAFYKFLNDLEVTGTLTASLPYSSITSKPSYFPADVSNASGTLVVARGGTGLGTYPTTGDNERIVAYDRTAGTYTTVTSGASRKFLTTAGGALAWDFLPVFNTTQDGAVPTPASALGATYYLNATGNWSVPTISSLSASNVTNGTFAGTTYAFTNGFTTPEVRNIAAGALAVGTTDAQSLLLNTFGITRVTINSSGLTTFANQVTVSSGGITVTTGGLTVTGASTITGTLGGVTTLTATTFSGSGSSLTNLQADQITAGTVPLPARLGTGGGATNQFLRWSSGVSPAWTLPPNFTSTDPGYAPASGGGTTNFLRADGSWQAPTISSLSASSVTNGTFAGTTYAFTNGFTTPEVRNIAGGTLTVGTTDAQSLLLNTSGTNRLTVSSAGAWTFVSAALSGITTLGMSSTLTVSSGGITVTGASTITGTLGGLTGLTVASGGITVTGASTITGTLGGVTTLTATTFSGSGASLTNLQADQLTAGTVPLPARLGTGGGATNQFLRWSSGVSPAWTLPPNFTSTDPGYAPASGGGTTNFLRADGTWQAPTISSISATNVTNGTFGGTTYAFTNGFRTPSVSNVAAGTLTVGTTDAQSMLLQTNGTTRLTISSAGAWTFASAAVTGITSLTTTGNLDVTGTITARAASAEVDIFLTRTGTNALNVYLYNAGTGAGFYDGTNARTVWGYDPSANVLSLTTLTRTDISALRVTSADIGLPTQSVGVLGRGGSGLFDAQIKVASGSFRVINSAYSAALFTVAEATGNVEARGEFRAHNAGSSTSGTMLLSGLYSDGSVANFGTMYSSGGPFMAYAVRSDTAAELGATDYFRSTTVQNVARALLRMEGSSLEAWSGAGGSYSVGAQVSMTKFFEVGRDRSLRLNGSSQGATGDIAIRRNSTDAYIYLGDDANRYIGVSGGMFDFGSTINQVKSVTNNTASLGTSSVRWSHLYSVLGYISSNLFVGSAQTSSGSGPDSGIYVANTAIATSRGIEFFCSDGTYNPRAWIRHNASASSHEVVLSSTFGSGSGFATWNFPTGTVKVGGLAGTGSRIVGANSSGEFIVGSALTHASTITATDFILA